MIIVFWDWRTSDPLSKASQMCLRKKDSANADSITSLQLILLIIFSMQQGSTTAVDIVLGEVLLHHTDALKDTRADSTAAPTYSQVNEQSGNFLIVGDTV